MLMAGLEEKIFLEKLLRLCEEKMKLFGEYLNKCCEYMLKHNEEI